MIIKGIVLNDAYIFEPIIHNDSRGYFYESYSKISFNKLINKNVTFIQDNQSQSSKGILRGLHFQSGDAAQSKLVRVLKGSVYDVAVDLRPDSSTFKKWHAVYLSDKNHLQFFIPRGFAHGFVALEDDTILHYKVDNYYSNLHDNGIHWNDKNLSINWPDLDIKVSAKDKNLPKLHQFNFKTIW